MKVKFEKTSINIIPEDPADEVYLETVLGLTKKGQTAVAVRRAPIGLDLAWAYVEIRKAFASTELEEVQRG